MFRWVRLISFADILTLANGLIGFIAITYILKGDIMSLHIATMLIFLAMLVDGLDGAVARRFGTKHSMGRHLDSISDSISFCMAPALMLYVTFYESPGGSLPVNALALSASLLMLGFGMLRLARFTVKGFKHKNFSGIPTPAATFFVFTACEVFGRAPPFVSTEPLIILPLSIIIAFFMILDVEYPKVRPRGKNLWIVASLVALMFLPVALAWFVYTALYYVLIQWVVLITFVSIVLYLLFGPLYVKVRKLGDAGDRSETADLPISRKKSGAV